MRLTSEITSLDSSYFPPEHQPFSRRLNPVTFVYLTTPPLLSLHEEKIIPFFYITIFLIPGQQNTAQSARNESPRVPPDGHGVGTCVLVRTLRQT